MDSTLRVLFDNLVLSMNWCYIEMHNKTFITQTIESSESVLIDDLCAVYKILQSVKLGDRIITVLDSDSDRFFILSASNLQHYAILSEDNCLFISVNGHIWEELIESNWLEDGF